MSESVTEVSHICSMYDTLTRGSTAPREIPKTTGSQPANDTALLSCRPPRIARLAPSRSSKEIDEKLQSLKNQTRYC